LVGVEGTTVEAGEASGAAALNMGYLAVRSGMADCVLVVGVEKITDMVGAEVEAFVAQSGDYDYEGMQGITPNAMAGLLIPVTAHHNALNNPLAMYRREVDLEAYQKAPAVQAMLKLHDMPSYADGAAAVVLVNEKLVKPGQKAVQVSACEIASDTLAVHDRADMLAFDAVRISTEDALRKAGITRDCLDLFECWDAPSIYGMLSFEAAGFAERGRGWQTATPAALALDGRLPIASLGGIKARGFAPGAAGIYQVVDAVMQLRGTAGKNQIADARTAMTQALSGAAASAVTTILRTL
jgi:acetyl-CoA C-acetyltransferase